MTVKILQKKCGERNLKLLSNWKTWLLVFITGSLLFLFAKSAYCPSNADHKHNYKPIDNVNYLCKCGRKFS